MSKFKETEIRAAVYELCFAAREGLCVRYVCVRTCTRYTCTVIVVRYR